jgi:hypothetical protein
MRPKQPSAPFDQRRLSPRLYELTPFPTIDRPPHVTATAVRPGAARWAGPFDSEKNESYCLFNSTRLYKKLLCLFSDACLRMQFFKL